jgi:integrase
VALSKESGVSIGTMKSCVDGKNVARTSAEKISTSLNMEVTDLFTPQEDKGLSDKTILHYHRLMSVILQTAVYWQVIFANPCDRVKPPKVERKEARYLDENEAAELLAALDGEPYQYQVMVKLALFLGIRRGELCGTVWSDVDYHTKCLHIQRSSLYCPDKGVFEDITKTYDSKRVIKMPDNVVELLQEYYKWQDERRKEVGSKWHECGRLFTTADGKPIHPDTVSGWLRKFIARKNLPDVPLKSLRHTNATLLIMSGVPLKTVSSRLGHSSPVTTSNIYSHAIKSADEAAAEVLQNILAPKENMKIRRLRESS